MRKKKERFEALGRDGLEIKPKYIGVEFWKMSCGRKAARILQYCLYTFFASVWFYFAPWFSLLLSYRLPY